jgi:ketosteroid isomerase-like protein
MNQFSSWQNLRMRFYLHRALCGILLTCLGYCLALSAQLPEPGSQPAIPNPLVDSTMSPGKTLLFDLEARFVRAVAARGGAAFQDWFAPDGVLLGNGTAPVVGLVAIARSVHWSPASYQLTWTPSDAVMSPAGDMGYTWGHYEGHSKDLHGHPVSTSGRYVSIWRRQPDGAWKVALDASANEPPSADDCCRLPAPGK